MSALLFLISCGPKPVAPPPVAAPFPSEPAVTGLPDWSPPVPERAELETGIPVWVSPDAGLPLVSIRVVVPVGTAHDPAEKWGLAALAAAMMEESIGDLSTLQRAAAVDRLAIRLGVSAGRDATIVSLDTHADRLDEALPLLAQTILSPAFKPEDFERLHRRQLTSIRQGLDDNGYISSYFLPTLWYGAEHPYGHPPDGTLDTVAGLTNDDIKQWHRDQMHAIGATIVVVGDVAVPDIIGRLDKHLRSWGAGPQRLPQMPPAAADHPRLVLVNTGPAAQTHVHVISPGPDAVDEARAAAKLSAIVVGGSFTSRLNQKLREEKGYTYGARMRVSDRRRGGSVSSYARVQTDVTGAALVDFLAVLKDAAEAGFTEAEHGKALGQAQSNMVEQVESRSGLAGLYAGELSSGRHIDQIDAEVAGLMAVAQDQMGRAARSYMHPERSMILLVGDATAVLPQLEAAGLPKPDPIIELSSVLGDE